MSAADRLTKIFAKLNIASPQNPGKPSKRKKKVRAGAPASLPPGASLSTIDKRAEIARGYRLREPDPTDPTKTRARPRFTGALSPTRCGATQSQSRSVRLDGETSLDIAACLSVLTDPITYQLVVFAALPGWRMDMHRLCADLAGLVIERAMELKLWADIVHLGDPLAPEDQPKSLREDEPPTRYIDIDRPLLTRIVVAVLHELHRADACRTCQRTPGKVLDLKAKPPQWVTCKVCRGSSRVALGVEARAKLLHMRSNTFRHSDARAVFDWLLRQCNSRIEFATRQIQIARGSADDDGEA